MINGEYNLRFAYPVNKDETDPNKMRMVAYLFRPPRIPKRIREYDKDKFGYVWKTINDEKTAFRVLNWYLKNKLIAIQTGLVSIEEEFMSHIVLKLQSGQETTLGDKLIENDLPQLAFTEGSQGSSPTDEKRRELRMVNQ